MTYRIERGVILSDLRWAVGAWQDSASGVASPRDMSRAISSAVAALSGKIHARSPDRALFSLVTKGPHLRDEVSLACVAARLVAFGATIHSLSRIENDGERVARTLYPRAVTYYEHGPVARSLWDQLEQRFDNDDFQAIFGCRYDPSLVSAGAAVLRDNNLSSADLTAIWEGGRTPVSKETLVCRYGRQAAAYVLNGDDQYDWFRGPLPVGISRIGPDLTAFAMRDERINDGAPVIVLNGHVPGLATLFEPMTWVFEAGIDGQSVNIGDVRNRLVGADNRPERCRPGSIRHDAISGRLRLPERVGITSRYNLLHCSDGLLTGLMEARGLRPDVDGPDGLTNALAASGLIRPEIEQIVLKNPLVAPSTSKPFLSDLTRGLDLASCIAQILRVVPPVFGPTNGYADGVPFEKVDRTFKAIVAASASLPVPGDGPGPVTRRVTTSAEDEKVGRAVIARAGVGMLVPAGGTGGRFGGYDLPESHQSRQKALVPAFKWNGRLVSSLDIRLANHRFWNRYANGRMPIAVTGSSMNLAAIEEWRSTLDEPYRSALEVMSQHGIYRLDSRVVTGDANGSWVHAILRDRKGQPSLKPAGHLGVLSGFVISGLLDKWERTGVSYVVTANADDVGHRLDPGILGYLERNAEVDAVICGIAWGYSFKVISEGTSYDARGDESGWSMDERGMSLAERGTTTDRKYDSGDALLVSHDGRSQRLLVGRVQQPGGTLFNTNQIYLRIAALDRIMADGPATNRIEAMQGILSDLPMTVEQKVVRVDQDSVPTVQLAQPLHFLVRLLDRCDVFVTTRRVTADVRSSYAPLKAPTDIKFAQLILDSLISYGSAEMEPISRAE